MPGNPKPLFVCLLALVLGGCNIQKFAMEKVADGLAETGTTFSSDNDPQLVRDALPFALKMMESTLGSVPEHRKLLTTTCSSFTQYTYAFVQEDADELEARDLAGANALRDRARALYLRARDYGLRGLETAHPGISARLKADPKSAVLVMTKEDIPLMYWTAASWGSAISLSKMMPELIADQVIVEALIDRAMALDESYDSGALHGFLITYEMARQGGKGDAATRSRRHFDRAMELTGGQSAGPLVSLAESVCIQQQKKAEFQSLLKQAIAIDVNAKPEWRLMNLIMQRRARWLLSRMDDLFVD